MIARSFLIISLLGLAPAWAGGAARSWEPEELSFTDDILPLLSKAGCNGSGCHSKPEGQNGFKLSVFAYDPAADFREITEEARGRRISRTGPESSLLLLKATQAIPHEGGQRFDQDSEAYHAIVEWIRRDTPYECSGDSALQRIEVVPADQLYEMNAQQAITVTAFYEGGRVRDVTRLTDFDTSKDSVAEINPNGLITVGQHSGDAVITARFMGQVATARVTVPPIRKLSEALYAQLPVNNFIDELAYDRFQKLGLFPSDPCDDARFLRRVSLDLLGKPPTAQAARDFLADTSPDKRAALVNSLLEDPHYADHWGTKWADLLRPNPDRAGVKSVLLLDQWIREQFRQNRPYDAFVRDILTAQGNTHQYGPTVIYRDRREPADRTTLFSQIFLGVRLECAKCHHHPNEKWSQKDFYQLAAYFGQLKQKGTGVSPPISGGWEVFYHAPGGSITHPVTGEILTPKAPDGPIQEITDGSDPRLSLAAWLTNPENPFFAKALVNRVWAELFGRGIVDPVDDIRATNPATNEALLDALAQHFVESGYDIKALLRTLTASALYQQDSEPNEWNLEDTENFARSYRRRLAAETLTDAVTAITQVADDYDGLPKGALAKQVWNFKTPSNMLDAFGRPDSSSDCPCERNLGTSVVQALHLMNATELQNKLSNKNSVASRLAASDSPPEEIVENLYLEVYSRFPSKEETSAALSVFSAPDTSRQAACEDLLWALLNSAEFVFNH